VNALLEDNLDAVYRYTLRLTRDPDQAQDLAQETMLRAWKKTTSAARSSRSENLATADRY